MNKSLFKMISVITILALMMMAVPMQSARAATMIAQWNFESPNPADAPDAATYPNAIAPAVGAGNAGGVHASAATDWTTPAGNGSADSFSSNNWAIGDYYEFTASTLNFTGIQLSWDQTRSSTGPSDFKLAYSTDGTTFADFGSPYTILANTWSSGSSAPTSNFTRDLSAIAALDNQANVYFRLIATSAAGGTAGTNRVDNFTVSGNPIGPSLPTVNLSVDTNSASEAAATVVTVTATASSAVTGDQTVDLGVSGTGITAGDYTLTNTLITILSGQTSGSVTFTVVDDSDSEGAETAELTISNTSAGISLGATTTQNVTIIDNDVLATRIHDIQGATHTSPLYGQTVSNVPGIVTALATNGFYLQDPSPDADDKTSEGIFVFTSSAPSVAVGDSLLVSGTVAEFRPGGNANNLTITEITNPSISIQSSGNPLPAAVILGDGGRTIPTAVIENDAANVENSGTFDPAEDGIDFYESLEGMRVQVNNPVTTSPTAVFSSSEEIWVLADNGANASSRTSRGGSLITASDFNPERIQIDDLINASVTLPIVNVGAQLSTITGVVNYDFSNYEVLVSPAPSVLTASTLTKEVTTLTGTANLLTVSTFNVENLDPGDGAAKFNALATAIVDNLKSPDILNLEEIQDNNGPTNDSVVDADVTLQTLINAIVAAGGPTYQYRQINPVDDTNGGEPGGNIRVGFLFNPTRVSFVDRPGGTSTSSTTVTNNAGTPSLSFSPGLIDPANAAFNSSRKPIVGEFLFSGQTVYVIGNHFSSKGGDQPLFGPNQPPTLSSEVQRNLQATVVKNFVQSILAINPNANIVVAGDLNDFEFSNPLTTLESGGLNTLVETLPANERYTYNFEGNAQVLDQMLVSNNLLANLDGFDVVHINSEFSDQVSDHDPVIARLNLNVPTYTLQLLHYYGESGLLGVETGPIMGAMIDKFDDQYGNTLVLGEGDSYIPGPWLVGGADPSLNSVPGIGTTALGRPDIAIMNAFGTDASALGNHEFDLGSPVLQGAIQNSGTWVGAQFPLITANLNFAADSSLRGIADKTLNNNFNANDFAGKEASTIKGKIAPYAIVTQGGEKIGLVGATTYDLLIKTSPNGTVPKDDGNPSTDDLQEVAAYIQAAVNSLNALGVNKIVMVDQLDTIDRNKLLAPLVSGIDVMIAGGGHERMGDATDTPVGFNGHTADFISDAYPIVTAGLDGKPTLIVTTDTEYTYLGRLVLSFDTNGEIILPSLDPVINGAYASTEANLQAAYGTTDSAATIIAGSTIGAKVNAITQAINNVILVKDGTVWGYTNVYLEGDRAFGRTQEVNLGDFTADANIYVTELALGNGFITSLKNGGGLRASIGSIDEDGAKIPPIANPLVGKPAGAISTLDIENALRFDNKLMVFDTTPQGLKNIIEFAAGLSSGPTQQSGGYMQIGGMRVSYDYSSGAGNRVKSIALTDRAGNFLAGVYRNGAFTPDAPATIKMVILNFTANGGDGYPTKANGDNFRYLLTDGTVSAPIDELLDFTAAANVPANALGEQKAFQNYLQEFYDTPANAFNMADTPVALDERIQILPMKPVDTVFPPFVTIDQAAGQADPTGISPIQFTVVFSESVTGFDGSDISLSGTANPTTAAVTGGPITYDVAVSGMTANGTVIASIPANAATSAAGDGNTASTSTDNTVTFNNTAPTIVVAAGGICSVSNGTMNLTLNDADGNLLTLSGSSSNTSAVPNANILFGGIGSNRTVTITGIPGTTVRLANVTVTVSDGVATAKVTIKVVVGTNGGDSLVGSNGADLLLGFNGNNAIFALDGMDVLCSGTGNDAMFAGNGDDTLVSGNGNDTLYGGGGLDLLNSGAGQDIIEGGPDSDTLDGGDNNDLVLGGLGNDSLNGGNGNDTCNGGPGTDSSSACELKVSIP